MNSLSAKDLACMQAYAESSFFDSCKLGTTTPASFGDDPGVITVSYANEILCGFKSGASREVKDGTQTPLYDALLRLPVGTVVSNIDRVCITKRFGVALTSEEYFSIEGAPAKGPSALVLRLKLITGDTAL